MAMTKINEKIEKTFNFELNESDCEMTFLRAKDICSRIEKNFENTALVPVIGVEITRLQQRIKFSKELKAAAFQLENETRAVLANISKKHARNRKNFMFKDELILSPPEIEKLKMKKQSLN